MYRLSYESVALLCPDLCKSGFVDINARRIENEIFSAQIIPGKNCGGGDCF
jgi:hypothetical protein